MIELENNLSQKEILFLCEQYADFKEAYLGYKDCWLLSEKNPSEAYDILKKSLPVFIKYAATSIQSLCECLLGKSSLIMGNFDVSNNHFENGIKLARSIDFNTGKTFNLMYHAILKSRQGEIDIALQMWAEAEPLCHVIKRPELILDINFNKGTALIEAGKYVEAFELYTNSLEEFREISDNQRIANTYTSLATIYFILGDSQQAMDFTNKSLQLSGNDPSKRLPILINAAINFCSVDSIDIAIQYLNECKEIVKVLQDRYFLAFIDKIEATILSKKGKFTLAKPLLVNAAQTFKDLQATRLYVYCIHALAKIALKENDVEQTIEKAESIIPLLQSEVDDPVMEGENCLILAESYSRVHRVYDALQMEITYRELKEKWIDQDRRRLFALHEIRMKLREKEYENEQLEEKNRLLQMDNDKKIRELTVLAMNLTQKNNIISTIGEELRSITKNGLKEIDQNIHKLTTMIDSYMKSSFEWENFEKRFNLLFPEYQKKLLNKFPGLTPAEVRICLLLKADLSTKEIGSILCISTRAVEGHRLSLRKKMGLTAKESLVTFLQNIT